MFTFKKSGQKVEEKSKSKKVKKTECTFAYNCTIYSAVLLPLIIALITGSASILLTYVYLAAFYFIDKILLYAYYFINRINIWIKSKK